MEYSSELAEKIDSLTEIEHSSVEEIEIRAATILAVDAISKKSKYRMAIEVDWILWQLGEKSLASLKPHH